MTFSEVIVLSVRPNAKHIRPKMLPTITIEVDNVLIIQKAQLALLGFSEI
jgi:hypothetical protein